MNEKRMMDCEEFAAYLLSRKEEEKCFFTIETADRDVWYCAMRLRMMDVPILMLGCPGGGEFALFDFSLPAQEQVPDELKAFLERYLKEIGD